MLFLSGDLNSRCNISELWIGFDTFKYIIPNPFFFKWFYNFIHDTGSNNPRIGYYQRISCTDSYDLISNAFQATIGRNNFDRKNNKRSYSKISFSVN